MTRLTAQLTQRQLLIVETLLSYGSANLQDVAEATEHHFTEEEVARLFAQLGFAHHLSPVKSPVPPAHRDGMDAACEGCGHSMRACTCRHQ